ncbi:MlaD family protein [Antrihabitans sp. YC2-6]|uniref:MlaD family protein n=1 Tax=Antrihabitans sp. YC2-6 TaxID=2799498 RepID=UPI0018F4EB6F|nr:MlaD family protein [Antrihabitans sp. YC2-6]MBJ8345179.1 MCE family protein [Antrihabitans sp. YC2-6]
MTTNRKVVISVAAVTAVAVFGAAGYTFAGRPAADAQSFCADMPDAIGLYEGNAVTQMGYKVGTIDGIDPDGDRVKVSFTLEGDRAYPSDVKAITRSKSLLADRSLELVGNYEAGPMLVSGECIPMDRTFTPKSISEIAGSAADFIDAMAPSDGSLGFERAVTGMDEALRGTGELANAMMTHAANAATSPDQVIADIGTTIQNMAPLTDEALQRWSTLRSILDQLPAVAAAGVDLWPGPTKVAIGVGWLVATLYDIQRNYGDLIWPLMDGGVADVIHLAASKSKDIAALLDSIPSVAGLMRQQAASADGLAMTYQPPNVLVDVLGAEGN